MRALIFLSFLLTGCATSSGLRPVSGDATPVNSSEIIEVIENGKTT